MLQRVFVMCVVVFAAATAGAQPPPAIPAIPVPGAPVAATVAVPVAAFALQAPSAMGIVALDAVEAVRPVLNAPYSAEAVTEVVQHLADGNRIEQRTTATIARDSHGRIRREQNGLALGAFVTQSDSPLVTITDPASQLHTVLNYEQRVAYRTRAIAFATRADATAPRPRAEAARGTGDAGRRLSAAPRLQQEMAGVPWRAPGVSPDFGIRLELPPDLSNSSGAANATPGVRVEAPGVPDADVEVRTETLGVQIVEGVRAEGTRTTSTIPAGRMGNVLPIAVVSERWYSPELQVVVMTRRVDPRFGETVYRLTNIVRAEPPSDLFEIPPDFRVDQDAR